MKIESSNYLSTLSQLKSSNSSKVANSTSDSSAFSSIIRQRFDEVNVSSDAYAAYDSSMNGKTSYENVFESLVNDGTITSDQADAIQTAMSSDQVDISNGSNPLKTVLDGLVSDGTITSDQKDAIATALAPTGGGTGGGIQDEKPMGPPPPPPEGLKENEDTDEEDYLQELLQGLLESDETTDDQKSAIENILNESTLESEDNSIQSILNSLMSSRLISQQQASSIAQALGTTEAE